MKGDRLTRYVIVAVIGFWLLAIVLCSKAEADTVNVGDANCGDYLSVSNRVYKLTENMSCPDIGFNVVAPNVTIYLNGYTLTYGDDGVGSGPANGCQDGTRSKIENQDCYWNAGGTGIRVPTQGRAGLKVIGPGKISCGTTDTAIANTNQWSMSAIVSKDSAGLDAAFENCEFRDFTIANLNTPNSRPIISEWMSGTTIENVVCSSNVFHKAIDTSWQAVVPHMGNWQGPAASKNVMDGVKIYGRFKGTGVGGYFGSNSIIKNSRIEAGELLGTGMQEKNSYGFGQTDSIVACTLLGGVRGVYMEKAGNVFSSYFDIHVVPESGSQAVPGGGGWAIKMQTYGGWTGRSKIKYNYIRVSCREASDGPIAGISIDFASYGDIVAANIDSNDFVVWSYKDSVGTAGYLGDFATAMWVDAEDIPWRKDSISFFDNHIKTNNRAFSSSSPDNYGCDSFYANCNLLERWDTLHTGATYSPKYKTYDIRDAGEVGWRFEGLTFSNGASQDSGYVTGGAETPTFGSFECGAAPICNVSPTSLPFGDVQVDQTKLDTFIIWNSGDTVLPVNVTEACAGFSITAGGGVDTLAIAETLTVIVQFAPTVAQVYNCTIETGNNTYCSDVSALGTGTNPPIAGRKVRGKWGKH